MHPTSNIDHLRRLAAAFAEHRGQRLTAVSRAVFGSSTRIAEILGGADIGVRRLEQAILWFSENWPDDLPWPAGIPGVPPSSEEVSS